MSERQLQDYSHSPSETPLECTRTLTAGAKGLLVEASTFKKIAFDILSLVWALVNPPQYVLGDL